MISPHLDDAVLSCAGLLAGAVVATVCTVGGPGGPVTDWDKACGFGPGDDVMAVRKREDQAALALLGARPEWLGVVEGQYAPLEVDAVVAAVREVVARVDPRTVAVPLGVDHVDHRLIADVCFDVVDRELLVYLELPYATRHPHEVDRRLAELDLPLEAYGVPAVDPARKRAAVHCYRTQCRPLWGDLHQVMVPERCYRVSTLPGRTTRPGSS